MPINFDEIYTCRKVMSSLKQWSSLQKSVSKLPSKKFYDIDPCL
jgi:hypothetical protein